MTILLDQNIPRSIKPWLKEYKPKWKIFHTSELGLSEVPDSVIFDKAEELSAAIITFDEDFTDIRLFKKLNVGIIRLNLWPTTVEIVKSALKKLFSEVNDNEINNSLIIVDKLKFRIRKIK